MPSKITPDPRRSHYRKPRQLAAWVGRAVPGSKLPGLSISLCLLLCGVGAPADTVRWDPATRRLLQPGGVYPRLTRVGPGRLLLSFELNHAACVRVSADDGKTFGPVVAVAARPWANCANPQPLALPDGRVLLFYNVRPRRGVDRPFSINVATSTDGGVTWADAAGPIYAGGSKAKDGVYEPAAVRRPDGTVDLFFASEHPYAGTGQQEITRVRSADGGKTWGDPRRATFRGGGRDGMPVPVLLAGGHTLAVAIEDNGLTADRLLKPAVVTFDDAVDPVDGRSERRRAVDGGTLAAGVYAGAPYLAVLPDGRTVASCQSDAGRPGHARMVVFVGDEAAGHFGPPTEPFAVPAGGRGEWNALYVAENGTVTALSTTSLDGKPGVWAIDGRVGP